jgi:hypothetical protein
MQKEFWAYGTFITNRAPLLPPVLGVPLGASKMISEARVHFAQTVHLSCIDSNTISKWEARFQMTYVT